MATQKRLQKEDIEKARQVLLAAIYSELPDDRFIKKKAVKQLLSTLIAARKCGMPFEKIAEILKSAGIELTTETLRSYFFELKTQEELTIEAQRHAMKIIQTKAALEKKALEQHTEHAANVAVDHVRCTQASLKFVNAFGKDAYEVADSSIATRQFQPAAQQPIKLTVRDQKHEVNQIGIPTLEVQNTLPVPTFNGETPLTLDAIEKSSLTSEGRTELEEDLEMRGVHVFYVSGKPFHGQLTKKQIRLLRTVGKIIAPTKGKSSKDFVAMPTKL